MPELDVLVKLASIGTAGVSIAAIIFIGKIILSLPNDAPEWKSALMKKYMTMCVLIALVCTASGGLNAYFNQEKIVKAEAQTEQVKGQLVKTKREVTQLGKVYDEQIKKVEKEKQAISNNIKSLLGNHPETLPPHVITHLNSTNRRVQSLRIPPRSTVTDSP